MYTCPMSNSSHRYKNVFVNVQQLIEGVVVCVSNVSNSRKWQKLRQETKQFMQMNIHILKLLFLSFISHYKESLLLIKSAIFINHERQKNSIGKWKIAIFQDIVSWKLQQSDIQIVSTNTYKFICSEELDVVYSHLPIEVYTCLEGR